MGGRSGEGGRTGREGRTERVENASRVALSVRYTVYLLVKQVTTSSQGRGRANSPCEARRR